MNNYTQYVNVKNLIGKKITIKGEEEGNEKSYTIVKAQKKSGSIYLALVDIETAIRYIGYEEFVNYQIKELCSISLDKYSDELHDVSTIYPIIIKVDNIFLRRPGAETSCNEVDYKVVYDESGEIFWYDVSSYEDFEQVHGNPFIVYDKPVAKLKDIDFAQEEKQLRKLFAEALPEDIRKQYITEFKQYCTNKIIKLNQKYLKHAHSKHNEAKREADLWELNCKEAEENLKNLQESLNNSKTL